MLPPLRQADNIHDMEDSLPSLHLTEHSDLKGGGEWQHVLIHPRRHIWATVPPFQVPLQNRHKALQVELNDNEDNGLSILEVLGQPTSCTKATSAKGKKPKQVSEMGDCLLEGAEEPMCRWDPFLREVCCLPWAWIKDVKRKLHLLVWPSDCYLLGTF